MLKQSKQIINLGFFTPSMAFRQMVPSYEAETEKDMHKRTLERLLVLVIPSCTSSIFITTTCTLNDLSFIRFQFAMTKMEEHQINESHDHDMCRPFQVLSGIGKESISSIKLTTSVKLQGQT